MQETLITFETAKLAKEKGFDLIVRSAYHYNGSNCIQITTKNSENLGISAPTQSFLQKWLREVHNIEVFVRPFINGENHDKHYRCFIVWFDGRMYQDNKYFSNQSYEEALEAGLLEALKLINL